LTQRQYAALATDGGVQDIPAFDSGVKEGRAHGTQPDAAARRVGPDRREEKRQAARMRSAGPDPGTESDGLAV